jgi:hypothetical protein
MTPRVYVAGASAERAEVAKYIERLRKAGAEITHDWVADIEASGGLANVGLTPAQRLEYALVDLEGVRDADIFWLLLPSGSTIGAWVELGAAITWGMTRNQATDGQSGKPHTIVSGDNVDRTIFTSLTTAVYGDHEDAYKAIVDMVQR